MKSESMYRAGCKDHTGSGSLRETSTKPEAVIVAIRDLIEAGRTKSKLMPR
jgi:hypothetical protein